VCNRVDHCFDRLANYSRRIGITLHQCGSQFAGLVERNMRRKQRKIRIGDGLPHAFRKFNDTLSVNLRHDLPDGNGKIRFSAAISVEKMSCAVAEVMFVMCMPFSTQL
jgi:hypothetical protein